MQAENAQDVWEEEFKRDLFRTNAELRSRRIDHSDAGGWTRFINQKIEELGADSKRMRRIVRAACDDVDWHEAVWLMRAYGLTEDQAADILDDILARRREIRATEDHPYERRRESRERLWSITGLIGFIGVVIALGLTIYYWSTISYLATGMRVCVGLWLEV